MLSKNETKYIQSLCHKKQRDELELFVVEGPKLVEEVLNSDFEVEKIYATQAYLAKHSPAKGSVVEVSEDELQKISMLQTANQVLMVARQKQATKPASFKNQLTLVLDGIQDPGNMGTIIRIADWFGVTQILCSTDCVEQYNPKVVQATMGSIVRVQVWYGNIAELLNEAGVPVYGAMLHGTNVFGTGAVQEGIVVIGSEGKGIRPAVAELVTKPVTIAKIGGAESLNAAVATGIILAAMRNQ